MTGVQTCALPISLRALGLRKINAQTVREDSPVLQGMLRRVASMVKVEEIDG